MLNRRLRPLILVRGFGGPDISQEQASPYQGFNDGTVYPGRRGDNYIYEGFVLRALKSQLYPYRGRSRRPRRIAPPHRAAPGRPHADPPNRHSRYPTPWHRVPDAARIASATSSTSALLTHTPGAPRP